MASQPEGEKDYEVYVASQKEMSLTAAGKRKWVERILSRSIVFIRCTDTLRRKEIVHLPYIKRFMVNIAGERRGGTSRGLHSGRSDGQASPDGGTCFVIRIDLLGCAKVSISRDLLGGVSLLVAKLYACMSEKGRQTLYRGF